jgi:uncharacterized protein (DUF2236 family)
MNENFMTFYEKNLINNRVNKFNIHWQIVRTKARKIKSVKEKLEYVLAFLDDNKNRHNYDRVLNWVKMTGVAYPKESPQREAFIEAEQNLVDNMDEYINTTEDNENNLNDISTKDLQMVFNDLSKRKYGFQYKNVPKDHIDFMDKLKKELATRKIN